MKQKSVNDIQISAATCSLLMSQFDFNQTFKEILVQRLINIFLKLMQISQELIDCKMYVIYFASQIAQESNEFT